MSPIAKEIASYERCHPNPATGTHSTVSDQDTAAKKTPEKCKHCNRDVPTGHAGRHASTSLTRHAALRDRETYTRSR